ncbi:hypothetical protein KGF54_002936 [Candida jiufengensis]|uniref:uncharacterized protein n=1 Tax=Candida jiufengensis TaxID=497108 RepID=UPI0022245500|nr:uncharacterized protein KGF54_002936 [Candida jiufengensis]KAI5953564.1 hypothetical protein KGF54_002936 [Candida jiufengensis]
MANEDLFVSNSSSSLDSDGIEDEEEEVDLSGEMSQLDIDVDVGNESGNNIDKVSLEFLKANSIKFDDEVRVSSSEDRDNMAAFKFQYKLYKRSIKFDFDTCGKKSSNHKEFKQLDFFQNRRIKKFKFKIRDKLDLSKYANLNYKKYRHKDPTKWFFKDQSTKIKYPRNYKLVIDRVFNNDSDHEGVSATDTELLTQHNGWKSIDLIDFDKEKIACYNNKSKSLIYQLASRITFSTGFKQIRNFDGLVLGVDQKVLHQLKNTSIKRSSYGPFVNAVPPRSKNEGHDRIRLKHFIDHGYKGNGNREIVTEIRNLLKLDSQSKFISFLELLGFFLGDGSLKFDRNGDLVYIIFAQIKLADCVYLEKLLLNLNLKVGKDWRVLKKVVQHPGLESKVLERFRKLKENDFEYDSSENDNASDDDDEINTSGNDNASDDDDEINTSGNDYASDDDDEINSSGNDYASDDDDGEINASINTSGNDYASDDDDDEINTSGNDYASDDDDEINSSGNDNASDDDDDINSSGNDNASDDDDEINSSGNDNASDDDDEINSSGNDNASDDDVEINTSGNDNASDDDVEINSSGNDYASDDDDEINSSGNDYASDDDVEINSSGNDYASDDDDEINTSGNDYASDDDDEINTSGNDYASDDDIIQKEKDTESQSEDIAEKVDEIDVNQVLDEAGITHCNVFSFTIISKVWKLLFTKFFAEKYTTSRFYIKKNYKTSVKPTSHLSWFHQLNQMETSAILEGLNRADGRSERRNSIGTGSFDFMNFISQLSTHAGNGSKVYVNKQPIRYCLFKVREQQVRRGNRTIISQRDYQKLRKCDQKLFHRYMENAESVYDIAFRDCKRKLTLDGIRTHKIEDIPIKIKKCKLMKLKTKSGFVIVRPKLASAGSLIRGNPTVIASHEFN